MRQLASIQKIVNIRPIENADKIEVAQVLGWECVVKKNEFKVGELVVYIEIDSRVPERPEFEFLRERKFKVKTIKLRKQISQGLVVPLSILPPKTPITEGNDVTEVLDITSYEKQIEEIDEVTDTKSSSKTLKFLMKFKPFRVVYLRLNTHNKGNFPSWIYKTDETRVQVCARYIMDNFDKSWYITEKLDGQSGTFFLHKERKWGFPVWNFGVCSRNIWLKTPSSSSYWTIAEKYDMEKKLRKLQTEIVIQGEVIGPKIQKNKYQVADLDFYVFNVVENGTKVSYTRMVEICNNLGLKTVPIINASLIPSNIWSDKKEVIDVVKAMVSHSEGDSLLFKRPREGVVWRLNENPNISLKVINPTFLLQNNEE